MVRLNLCKTLGIKLLLSLSGRRKLCLLGLRLERIEITGGNEVDGHIQHFGRQPLRDLYQHLPSVSRYQHCPLPHNRSLQLTAESLNPLSFLGTRQPPQSGASMQNPVDGSDSRDLEEWIT